MLHRLDGNILKIYIDRNIFAKHFLNYQLVNINQAVILYMRLLWQENKLKFTPSIIYFSIYITLKFRSLKKIKLFRKRNIKQEFRGKKLFSRTFI